MAIESQADLGEGPRGPRPPFFLVFSNWFWNVNVTLLLHVLKSEVFIRGGGGGGWGWGSRPPLSEFSEFSKSPLPRMLSCWLNGALFRGNWLSEQFIYYEKYYFNVFLVPWEINKRFRSKTRDRCFNMADFHFQRHRHLECFIRNLIGSMSLIRCDKIKSVMLF